MKTPAPPFTLCGTVTPLAGASAEMLDAMLDAVREANGRRAIRPAETLDAAAVDVKAFLVVPEWADGETAAALPRTRSARLHRLDAAEHHVRMDAIRRGRAAPRIPRTGARASPDRNRPGGAGIDDPRPRGRLGAPRKAVRSPGVL